MASLQERRWQNLTRGVAGSLGLLVAAVLSGCGGSSGGGQAATTGTATTTTATLTTTTYPLYTCRSTHQLANAVSQTAKKGMAIDDTTWEQCSDELTGLWPHTNTSINSLRMFAAWKPWWSDVQREQAWERLQTFVEINNAKVLMGVEVTCDPSQDDQMWKWGLELMQKLGKDRIMGVAIGNEIDNGQMPLASCRPGFWSGGFWKLFKERVADIDALGFNDTKVTVVWSLTALSEKPFKKAPENVDLFLTEAFKLYQDRFVWTFNPYAVWDSSQWPTSAAACTNMLPGILSIDYTRNVMAEVRKRITSVTGNEGDTLWIGETGWSSPPPTALTWITKFCPDYFSTETLVKFYEMIMSWDLSLPGVTGVDHLFYFTMRDSQNHGAEEGFGLVSKCKDVSCKYNSPSPGPSPPSPSPQPPAPGPKSTCAVLKCGNHDATCWCSSGCVAHNDCCDDYEATCGKPVASVNLTAFV